MDPAHHLQPLPVPVVLMQPGLQDNGQYYQPLPHLAQQQQQQQMQPALQQSPPAQAGQGRKRRGSGAQGSATGLQDAEQSVVELRKQQPKRQRQQQAKPTRICQVQRVVCLLKRCSLAVLLVDMQAWLHRWRGAAHSPATTSQAKRGESTAPLTRR